MKEYTFESEIVISARSEKEAWDKMDDHIHNATVDDLYVLKEAKKTRKKK